MNTFDHSGAEGSVPGASRRFREKDLECHRRSRSPVDALEHGRTPPAPVGPGRDRDGSSATFSGPCSGSVRLHQRGDPLAIPDNPEGRAVGFNAWAGDVLAGHYVTIPLRARVRGKEERGLLVEHGHPRRPRSKGLFTRLAQATCDRAASEGYGFRWAWRTPAAPTGSRRSRLPTRWTARATWWRAGPHPSAGVGRNPSLNRSGTRPGSPALVPSREPLCEGPSRPGRVGAQRTAHEGLPASAYTTSKG